MAQPSLYHRVWRWHFYAGLLIVPVAISLALTGAIYLFNAEFNSFVESRINMKASPMEASSSLSADELADRAVITFLGAKLRSYIIEKSPNDPTVEMELSLHNGDRHFIWMDRTTGEVLDHVGSSDRFMQLVKKFHGELLSGDYGTLIVELSACWMIVMIITGLYLWLPRSGAVFAPALYRQGRIQWKALHGVIGLYSSVFVLLLLISGLPWTTVWGTAFRYVQEQTGQSGPGQEFRVTLQSSKTSGNETPVALETIKNKAISEKLLHPVVIKAPRGANGVWTVRSMIQNRPQRQTIHYDKWTGQEVMRIGFSDYPVLKKITSLGIAMHEGHLFGVLNQILGVLAALAIIVLSISGLVMAWRRRPQDSGVLFCAPPLPREKRLSAGIIIGALLLAVLLPLVGASLVVLLVLDSFVQLMRRIFWKRAAAG